MRKLKTDDEIACQTSAKTLLRFTKFFDQFNAQGSRATQARNSDVLTNNISLVEEKISMQNPPPDQQGYGYNNQYGTPPPNAPLSTPPGGGPKDKSAIGMDANLTAALGYPVGLIAIIEIIIEKQNRFARFHALQSILFHVV